MMLKYATYVEPIECLGEAVRVYLKARKTDGDAFHFKITECGPAHISGYDSEGLDLRIDVGDIDFILG